MQIILRPLNHTCKVTRSWHLAKMWRVSQSITETNFIPIGQRGALYEAFENSNFKRAKVMTRFVLRHATCYTRALTRAEDICVFVK